jgi:hypothetical protein
MNKSYLSLMFILLLVLFSSCSKPLLKQAFDGKLSIHEGNKVIYEYCQSCHAHRSFSADDHVINASKRYPSENYKRAKRCSTCHFIEENFWGDITRKTQFPYMVESQNPEYRSQN